MYAAALADTFTVPCDHASGTNIYHAHHHGSVALQVCVCGVVCWQLSSALAGVGGAAADSFLWPER
jgi:hypothetical protein